MAETVEFQIEALGDPASSVDHIIRVRTALDAANGPISLQTEWRQGGSALSTPAVFTDLISTATPGNFAHTLSAAQADAITNYGDIHIRLTATASVQAPTYVGKSTAVAATATNNASFTPVPPNGAVGDLLLLVIQRNDATLGSPTVSGWTNVAGLSGTSGTTQTVATYWKIASSATGTADQSAVTFGSGTVLRSGFVARFRGVDATTPIHLSSISGQASPADPTTTTNITSTINNTLGVFIPVLIGARATTLATTNWPAATGVTAFSSIQTTTGNDMTFGLAAKTFDAAGSFLSPAIDWNTNTTSGVGSGLLMALAPQAVTSKLEVYWIEVGMPPSTVPPGLNVTPTPAAAAATVVAPSVVESSTSSTPTPAAATAAVLGPTVVQSSLTLAAGFASAATAVLGPAVVQSSLSLAPTPAAAATRALVLFILKGDTAAAPAAASAAAATIDPTVIVGSPAVSVTPTPAAAAVAVLGPTVVHGSLTLIPTAAAAASSAVDPTVLKASTSATPTASQAAAATVGPTVVLGSLSLTPTPAAAAVDALGPTVVQASLAVAPGPSAAAAAIVAPTVAKGATSSAPTAASAATAIVAPTVVHGSLALAPAPAAAAAAIVAPTALKGSTSVAPAPAAAVAATVDPTVVSGGGGTLVDAYGNAILAVAGHYWRLGDVGATAVDSIGGLDGARNNLTSAVSLLYTRHDGASVFDGSSGNVEVPDDAGLDLGDTFSVEMIFKRGRTFTLGSGNYEVIFSRGDGSVVFGFGEDNKVFVNQWGGPSIAVSTVAVTDTTTAHHLVITKTAGSTSGNTKIYLDGADVTSSLTGVVYTNSADSLTIGSDSPFNGGYTQATIDEVSILGGTAYSAGTVLAHYKLALTAVLQASPSSSTAGTVAPTVVKGSLSLTTTPGAAAASALAPAVIKGSLALAPAPAVTVAATVNPTVIATSPSITPAPAVAVAATVGPTVVLGALALVGGPAAAATATVNPTVVKGSVSVTPAPGAATAAVLGPVAVQGSLAVTPGPAASVAATVGPTAVKGSLSIVPGASTAASAALVGSIIAGSAIVVTPGPASAATTVLGPTVVKGAVSTIPAPAQAAASTVNPSVTAGALLVIPGAVSAATSRVNPTVVIGALLVSPAPASAATSAQYGFLFIGGSTALTPLPATASGFALVASVIVTLPPPLPVLVIGVSPSVGRTYPSGIGPRPGTAVPATALPLHEGAARGTVPAPGIGYAATITADPPLAPGGARTT